MYVKQRRKYWSKTTHNYPSLHYTAYLYVRKHFTRCLHVRKHFIKCVYVRKHFTRCLYVKSTLIIKQIVLSRTFCHPNSPSECLSLIGQMSCFSIWYVQIISGIVNSSSPSSFLWWDVSFHNGLFQPFVYVLYVQKYLNLLIYNIIQLSLILSSFSIDLFVSAHAYGGFFCSTYLYSKAHICVSTAQHFTWCICRKVFYVYT